MNELIVYSSWIMYHIALLVVLGAYIYIIKHAFHVHMRWGICTLLLPPALIVYCIKFWDTAKKAVYTGLASILISIVTGITWNTIIDNMMEERDRELHQRFIEEHGEI